MKILCNKSSSKEITSTNMEIIWVPANIIFNELVSSIEIVFKDREYHLYEFEVGVILHEVGQLIEIMQEKSKYYIKQNKEIQKM